MYKKKGRPGRPKKIKEEAGVAQKAQVDVKEKNEPEIGRDQHTRFFLNVNKFWVICEFEAENGHKTSK